MKQSTIEILQDILNSEKRVVEAENKFKDLSLKIETAYRFVEGRRLGPDRFIPFEVNDALDSLIDYSEQWANHKMRNTA